jgi:predicted Zn-dependent protease
MKKFAIVLAIAGSAAALQAKALGLALSTVGGVSASTVGSSVLSTLESKMDAEEKKVVAAAKPFAKTYIAAPNSMDKQDFKEAIDILNKYSATSMTDEEFIKLLAK